ncbi:MAG TPA: hypothetical protein DCW90_08790 [Lachnospiraceae bacterium]|nr:hypothetical protein [Lachnospiraceae bacterium]
MSVIKANNRKIKFVKDFGTYSIGVLGTRVITFLMIPLYTYFVENPSNYGVWDLCLQATIFLLPLSTLQMREAAFRFLFEENDVDKKKRIISFIFSTLTINLSVITLSVLLLSIFWHFQYIWLTLLLLLSSSFHDVMCQIARGLNRNDVYVSCNLINAALVAFLSIVFVAFLKMDISGIFLANIISRIMICMYLQIRLHILSYISSLNNGCWKDIGKEILHYSIPLIPMSMCWLVTTVSDRFFIKFLVSSEMTGVYAAAIRYTMILQSLALIFYQTWQETAIKEYNTPDKNQFFSKIFNYYVYVLGLLLIVYSYTLKFFYPWLVGPNYQEGAQYLFMMGGVFLLGAVSSSFFDLGYQCAKETKRALPAIILAAVINVCSNLLATPRLGVNGVILSNFFSYLALGIYRYIDTKRYFRLTISSNLIIMVVIVISGLILYSVNFSFAYDVLIFIVLLFLSILAMPKGLKSQISILLHKRK